MPQAARREYLDQILSDTVAELYVFARAARENLFTED